MSEDTKIRIGNLTKAEEAQIKRASLSQDPLMKEIIAEILNPENPEIAEIRRQYVSANPLDLILGRSRGFDPRDLHQKPRQFKSPNDAAPKKVIPRENEMHVLLERVFKVLGRELKRSPSAKEVWRCLQDRRVEFDTDNIIYKFNGDTIEWRSLARNTKTMTYQAIANRISKIRQKLEKNHR
jgi:hypothetical protein